MFVGYFLEVCLTCCQSYQLPFILLKYIGLYVFIWPLQFSWLKGYIYRSCYYHHQVWSIHLSRCYHIFFRGSVPEMFVSSYSVTYCIYIPAKREFVVIIIARIMMSANSRIRFGLQIVFVCLYITPSLYHHCANLSDDIEIIKCLSDIFCRVCE